MSDLCTEFNKALSNTQKKTVPWIRDTLTCNPTSNNNQQLNQQLNKKEKVYTLGNQLTKAQKWSMISKRQRVLGKKQGQCSVFQL